MSGISLTPLDVTVSIPGVSIGKEVFVSSVVTTNVVNDFPAASVGLGYKTSKGRKQLQNIFPTEGSLGRYYQPITITASGGSTSLTTINGSVLLFKGVIVGFQEVKSAGDTTYQLNARGGAFPISQRSIITPGVHSASSAGYFGASLASDAAEDPLTRGSLIDLLKGDTDVVSMLLTFAHYLRTFYLNATDAFFSEWSERGAVHVLYGAAGKGIGPSDVVGAFQTIGLERGVLFTPPTTGGGTDGVVIDSVVDYLIALFMNNPGLYWWDFILLMFESFMVDVVYVGDVGYVFPKTVLMQPGRAINYFVPSDEVAVQLGDFPLFNPTRVLVDAVNFDSTEGDGPELEAINNFDSVTYPNDRDEGGVLTLTAQEEATGVKALFVNMPFYFESLLDNVSGWNVIDAKDKLKRSSLNAIRGGEVRLDEAEEKKLRLEAGKTAASLMEVYAKSIFYKERFKSRKGRVTSRFKPEAIPGMPGRIVDSSGVATFECWISSVTHSLDYQAGQASTTCEYGYARYGGELNPRPFPNPQYPEFKIEQLEAALAGAVAAGAGFSNTMKVGF